MNAPLDSGYDDTAAAMQGEMLSIDIEYADQWIGIMRRLVDAKLDHIEFTAQRMDALRDWERRRKAAQARLRWKYARGRRKDSLIDRDVRKQLEKARKAIAKAKAAPAERDSAAAALTPTETSTPEVKDATVNETTAPTATPTQQKPQPTARSLEGVPPEIIRRVEAQTGGSAATITDDEVRAFYNRAYLPEDEIEDIIRTLNGGTR